MFTLCNYFVTLYHKQCNTQNSVLFDIIHIEHSRQLRRAMPSVCLMSLQTQQHLSLWHVTWNVMRLQIIAFAWHSVCPTADHDGYCCNACITKRNHLFINKYFKIKTKTIKTHLMLYARYVLLCAFLVVLCFFYARAILSWCH